MKFYFKSIKLPKPSHFCGLAGFNRRYKTADTLGPADLFIKILWLSDHSDILFVTLDTLYIPKSLSIKISLYLVEKLCIAKESIIFNASHTHSAPNISSRHFGEINVEYFDQIYEGFCNALNQETPALDDCELEFSSEMIDDGLLINRRRIGHNIDNFTLKKSMLILPNSSTAIDNCLRKIVIRSERKDRLIIYNFSCHPTFNINKELSSDYIGEINKLIYKTTEVPSIFLQGFLGDIRPNVTSKSIFVAGLKNKIKVLLNKEIFRPANILDFKIFTETISRKIISLKSYPLQDTQIRSGKYAYTVRSQSGLSKRSFEVSLILIEKLLFISIPAEVSSQYFIHLSEKYKSFRIIPLGLADDIIGYLPFYTEIAEGGYEVTSATNYGWDSPLDALSVEQFYNCLIQDLDVFIKREF